MASAGAGLTVRPVRETVVDTWAWLSGCRVLVTDDSQDAVRLRALTGTRPACWE